MVVSRLPYVGLLNRMVRIIAPRYFDLGPSVLEAALIDFAKWPPPGGKRLDLPLLGELLTVCGTVLFGVPWA